MPLFTAEEEAHLVEFYVTHYQILDASGRSVALNRRRTELWEKLTKDLNAMNPMVKKTVKQVKDKIGVKKRISNRKHMFSQRKHHSTSRIIKTARNNALISNRVIRKPVDVVKEELSTSLQIDEKPEVFSNAELCVIEPQHWDDTLITNSTTNEECQTETDFQVDETPESANHSLGKHEKVEENTKAVGILQLQREVLHQQKTVNNEIISCLRIFKDTMSEFRETLEIIRDTFPKANE